MLDVYACAEWMSQFANVFRPLTRVGAFCFLSLYHGTEGQSWRDPGEANSTSSEQTILHGAGKWIFLERESGTICSTQIPLITQVWGATLPGLSWAPNPDRKQKWEAGRANLSPCCCSWWQSSTWHPLLSPSDPSFLLMISMRGPEILSWEEPEHPQISSPSLLPVQKAWVGST